MVSFKRLRDYTKVHPDCRVALSSWYTKLERLKPDGHHALKRAFPGTGYVGNCRYVFNIKGNRYRVIVKILFGKQLAYIRFIGTHAEYDKINCKEI
ncbi:MAG: type II toxin-antitoxin system HigB family toxin [Bacteroidales bacterium]|nr:type II toxin-antitoxin system HigB family toxin [Bacteroidales bacterium]